MTRDAQTDEIVTQEYAEAHPGVTVREAVTGHVGYAPGYAGGPVFFGDPKVIQDNLVPGRPIKETTPDLLALQVRVQQLEAALSVYADKARWYRIEGPTGHESSFRDGFLDSFPEYHEGFERAAEALSTPALDVSPLWELLNLNLALEQGEGDKAWAKAMNALTPTLRALIEEMAQGGRE